MENAKNGLKEDGTELQGGKYKAVFDSLSVCVGMLWARKWPRRQRYRYAQ